MDTVPNLLQRLTALGLSQSEIGRRTGIPQPRLSRWSVEAAKSANDVLKLMDLERQLDAERTAKTSDAGSVTQEAA